MTEHKDLVEKFRKAHDIDKSFFTEYRSFSNLFAGNHYVRQSRAFERFSREANRSRNKYAIRATRNHTNLIIKSIVNSILAQSPDVKPFPNNPSETQDMKAAELHDSVWQDFKKTTKWRKLKRSLAFDFVMFGEAWVFSYWDPSKGSQVAVEQEIDPITNEVLSEKPIFSGDVCHRRIMPYDVRRDESAKTLEESPWLGFVELRRKSELKKKLPEDVHNYLEASDGDSYYSYDYSNGKYSSREGMVEVKHYFARPSEENPKGQYIVFTDAGVLEQMDELPLGMFPLYSAGFDELPGSPRHISSLRQGKSYQVEINRLISSKIKAQLTLGDDKLIVQAGSSVSMGAELPGIRVVQSNGPEPKILPGRSGAQYDGDLDRTITEFYQIMGVREMNEADNKGQYDPNAMLFRSAKDKVKFKTYASKFEDFMIEICESTLRLKKAYLSEFASIKILGQSERVNIAEFKSMDDLNYSIQLEPIAGDIDEKFAKQLAITTALQYAGSQLPPDQIGLMIREMPYLNDAAIFENITQGYDRAKNAILALDRGEPFNILPTDPHLDTITKSIYTRMSKADFKYLHPQIQHNYNQHIQLFEQVKAEQLQKIQAMEQGFIPSDGPLVPIDGLYEEKIGAKGQIKSERVRLPLSAIEWLSKRLKDLGLATDPIKQMPPSLQAEISAQLNMANQIAVQNEIANKQQYIPQV